MYLGACGAINTIPISPMAPVWASHGLLNATCPAWEDPNIHLPSLPSTITHFSPQGGGHQDKQSMPMTDPRQTEHNYGNSVLRDTVSLKPTVSTPTTPDSFLLPVQAVRCVCVCVGLLCVLAHECQAGPVFLMCPHITFCVIAPEVADYTRKGAWQMHETHYFSGPCMTEGSLKCSWQPQFEN